LNQPLAINHPQSFLSMIILSHRGYWKEPAEKNTEAAFVRSFALGFGTETDLRDHQGQLVISHDPPTGPEVSADAFFALYAKHGRGLPLALNIKADGLQESLQTVLKKHQIPATDYFVFDMAVPDALGYLRRDMPAFTRNSELEPAPAFADKAAGIWVDGFFGDWFGPEELSALLQSFRRACVVSPELHGRSHQALWNRLANSPIAHHPGLMICTDRPEEAQALFHGQAGAGG
jgi:glycerophosphoryl diester phosphodiesterase